jgi:signal transduction histidine kinase
VRPEAIVRAGLARADAITRDHHLVTRIDEPLPDVSVEAAAMAEVIYILLDNATKYSPAGSTIDVRATRDGDHHVRIGVSDEGPGIPAEYAERVFDKFFRVPARAGHDRERGGAGLGLSIARRLVEAQAGRVWVEPGASGRGTTVMMTLPVSQEARETPAVLPAAAVGQ